MGTILTDLALRLYAQTSELKKGLSEANRSVKGFKDKSQGATKGVAKGFQNMQKQASSGLQRMTGGLSAFGGQVPQALGGFRALAGGATLLNTALGPIGIIIGAIALAVKALSSYFTGSVDGAEKFASIMGFIKGLLGGLQDIFIRLGRGMVKAFESPKDAIAGLWEAIKQNLVNRWQGLLDFFQSSFEALKNGFRALGKALKGVVDKDARKEAEAYFIQMQKDLAQTGKAALQLATGLDVEKTIKKVTAATKAQLEIAKQTAAIAADQKRLEIDRAKSLLRSQRLETEFQEQTLIAANTTLDFKERLDAALKAKEAIIAISKEEVAIATRAYQNQVKLNSLSETSQEDKIKEIELLKELEATETRRASRLKEAQEKINISQLGYQKIVEDAQKYQVEGYEEMTQKELMIAIDGAKQRLVDEAKAQAAYDAQRQKAADSWASYQIDKQKETDDGKIAILKDQLDKGLILQEEYAARVKDIQTEAAQEASDKQQELFEQTIANTSSGIDQLIAGWQSYFNAIKEGSIDVGNTLEELLVNSAEAISSISESLLGSLTNLFEASKNKELKAAGENAKRREEIEKKYARKQKTIAIAQAVINGALAIVKGFAQLGPIGGAIAAVLTTATTAAQIAVISSQSFAQGGIVSGPTLGLVGEYPGARSNPEVIAPLDKLQNLLGEGRTQVFRIQGEDLVAVTENYYAKLEAY